MYKNSETESGRKIRVLELIKGKTRAENSEECADSMVFIRNLIHSGTGKQ